MQCLWTVCRGIICLVMKNSIIWLYKSRQSFRDTQSILDPLFKCVHISNFLFLLLIIPFGHCKHRHQSIQHHTSYPVSTTARELKPWLVNLSKLQIPFHRVNYIDSKIFFHQERRMEKAWHLKKFFIHGAKSASTV